ncbi:hypothetical protein KJQ78_08815 [Campylobacter lari]|uniref:DUF5710 domain-containing protein n=1 Tax=Campylobacter TaxID=194 RepID=UPI001280AE16|nr:MULTISPECIES: DUF5710 domain-containing protein [Campylobacter]EAH4572131.1 conjugal transfer protein TraC [Campylobacter lari]MBT0825345.1 hypothetical protein [Campylobacter lari]MCV3444024.1 DUF5710 domain-containing protein [Campylobacter sp. IFREMER_LSEM_CL1097]
MNIKLNIPYSEKDKLKEYGIKWNQEHKTWYLQDYKNLNYVSSYLENKNFTFYATETLNIVQGFINCWKCSKVIPVYALGSSKFIYKEKGEWLFQPKFKIFRNITAYSEDFSNILKHMNIKSLEKSFSNTAGSSYLMNKCQCCQSKQGEFFLFEEIDSIFSPNTVKEAQQLKIYDFPLLFDLGFTGEIIEILTSECSDINALIWFNAERIKIVK